MRKIWISEQAVPGLGVLHGLWYMILTTTFVVCWNLLHWKAELPFPAARYRSGAHQATEWQELPDHQIGNSYSERNKRMSFRATVFQLWLPSFWVYCDLPQFRENVFDWCTFNIATLTFWFTQTCSTQILITFPTQILLAQLATYSPAGTKIAWKCITLLLPLCPLLNRGMGWRY